MTTPDRGADWRKHIIEDDAGVARVIEATRRIAVIGIKTDAGQPAYYVPEYATRAGFSVVPVPVYYPAVTEILGQPVFRTVASIPGSVDMVNVFRRSRDVAQHVDDIISANAKSVWMQLGIRNDEAAEKLARAGIDVVQDLCLMVELRHRGK
jgi:predicted CoA-binding protein